MPKNTRTPEEVVGRMIELAEKNTTAAKLMKSCPTDIERSIDSWDKLSKR